MFLGLNFSRLCAGILMAAALVLLGCIPANADTIEQEGSATVPCEIGTFSSHVDDSIRAKAMLMAEADALDRYSASLSKSQYALYQQAENRIKADIGNYIAQPVVIEEGYKKDLKAYSVVVRVSINTNAVSAVIGKMAGTAPEKSISLAVLFVARSTESVNTFKARHTNVHLADDQRQISQKTSVHSQNAAVSSTDNKVHKNVDGGSVLHQADKLTYQVSSPSDMNATMAQVFHAHNIDVYDYRDISAECGGDKPETVYQKFSASDELTGAMRHSVFQSAKKCEMRIFATGTLDSSMADTDPVSGLPRVSVSVRTQVYDISHMLPRVIASVGPVQYSGTGSNPQVAQRNALTEAARHAAEEISAQLRAEN